MANLSATRRRNPVVSRPYCGQSPDERRSLRRARLVAAGMQLFGTRGLSRTTIKEVCAQAGLTERYFYESFKTLGDLFAAVYNEVNNSLQTQTLAAVAQAPYEPMALIEAGLRVFLRFIRDDRRHAQILLVEAVKSRHAESLRTANQALRDYAGMLRDFSRALYPDAEKQGLDIDVIAVGLTGLNLHAATLWYFDDFKQPLEHMLHNLMFTYRSMHAALVAHPAAQPVSTP